MRKIQLFVLSVVVVLFTACHGKIWDAIEDLDSRVSKLEEFCKEMNTNISALQTIVEVIQENDFITGIVPIEKGGEVIGYTIMFGKHEPITIYNGEDGANGIDGKDGKDGYTPILGVAKDVNGVYYWTLDGEWLLDAEGNKIRVTGRDGKDGEDGKDGQDGTNGADGKDGITPQLKIEEGYWYISYDNGATWIELGKAVGEDGEKGDKGDKGDAGNDGQNGDSMFMSVTYDENNVYFTLTDGTILIISRKNTINENINAGHEYVDLGLSVKWATCNVGATRPEEYGSYFAWAEIEIDTMYNWASYKYRRNLYTYEVTKYNNTSSGGFVDNKEILDSEDDAATMNWHGDWRMPTYNEIKELRIKGVWTWTSLNGINGYNVMGPNGNSIFLPAAGYRSDNILNHVDSIGCYWSNTLKSNQTTSAYIIDFSSSSIIDRGNSRDEGLTVRPVCP